ncbi:hypothetical protein COJ50_08575 [Bacillus cereus]|uniref:Uncharacterized protein n=1 Tax=Bacillus cereus TaxID=1396 RepID=A0A2B1KRB1_BACCE|nr:hypothetical protein COJ50_08575 [Bacillus cereus]
MRLKKHKLNIYSMVLFLFFDLKITFWLECWLVLWGRTLYILLKSKWFKSKEGILWCLFFFLKGVASHHQPFLYFNRKDNVFFALWIV